MESDKLLTLGQASATVHELTGRKVSTPSLWRWARKGLNGVRLRYVRVGRAIMTRRQFIEDFFSDLAAADAPVGPKAGVPARPGRLRHSTPCHAKREEEEADKVLREAGIRGHGNGGST